MEIDKEEKGFGGIFGNTLGFRDFDEILDREVVGLGNSGKIAIPKKHIGKRAQVTIWRDDPENIEEAFQRGQEGDLKLSDVESLEKKEGVVRD